MPDKIQNTEDVYQNRQSLLLSANKVDSRKADSDQTNLLLKNKIDKRFTVDHTFSSTAEEAIDHNFGRLPSGAQVIGQDRASAIHIDHTKSTDRKIYATSSVSGAKVRFLIL